MSNLDAPLPSCPDWMGSHFSEVTEDNPVINSLRRPGTFLLRRPA